MTSSFLCLVTANDDILSRRASVMRVCWLSKIIPSYSVRTISTTQPAFKVTMYGFRVAPALTIDSQISLVYDDDDDDDDDFH